jgi:hypothetical protein
MYKIPAPLLARLQFAELRIIVYPITSVRFHVPHCFYVFEYLGAAVGCRSVYMAAKVKNALVQS